MSASSFTAALVYENCARKSAVPSHCTVVDVKPDPIGRLVGVQVVVADAPAGLGDLVPLARTLATRIGAGAIERAGSAGVSVPCRKGCAACCRYLVPLSVPEALCMGREIGSLSGSCDATTARALAAAAGRILEGGTESPFSETGPDDDGGDACDIESVGRWYSALDMDCPFLREETCTIYEKRPLACREHAVLGTAEHCEGFSPGRGNRLEIPVKVLDALGQLAAEVEQTEVQAVMMPLVPFWYEENRHRALRTWPGPELVALFLDCLAETASQAACEASGVPEAA